MLTSGVSKYVQYEPRSITIDGQRTLLLSGAIHYPRSTPAMWPDLMRRSREAGLNCIETYVFWNFHEPERGRFDFSGRLDLLRFCQLAQEYDLSVILRIGPYICAEINYGGFPLWLRDIPGIQMRTENAPFQAEMERWVHYLCDYLKPCFAPQGGPIILAQIENEYNLVADNYGEEGKRYLQWAADLGKSLQLGIPWIMCFGGADGAIETINSLAAHELLPDYKARHPDQPALWTENWQGWYDVYGNPHHTRSPQHIAYTVARFIAAGGAGVNYYMWHGGTNFAREAMFLQTTSYDYDAPLDEYGFPTTKYYHLAALNQFLSRYQSCLLDQAPPEALHVGPQQCVFVYNDADCRLIFLCNDSKEDADIQWDGQTYHLAAQSVLLLDGLVLLFDTAHIASHHIVKRAITPIADAFSPFTNWKEPPGEVEAAYKWLQVINPVPLEQLQLTHDTSDYCWYITTLTNAAQVETTGVLSLKGYADMAYVFVDGKPIASSTLPLCERRGSFDGPFFTQHIPLHLSPGTHRLTILCCAIGLIKGDWMIGDQNMVHERKGIWGEVQWNNEVLPGPWIMLPRLVGEHERRFDFARKGLPWHSYAAPDPIEPLTWWRTTFDLPSLPEEAALTLDLQGMHKGMVWLNGHCLGRYWLLEVHERDEWGNTLENGYSSQEPTQRYYHIPREWLQEENVLILFEEAKGDPSQIALCLRA